MGIDSNLNPEIIQSSNLNDLEKAKFKTNDDGNVLVRSGVEGSIRLTDLEYGEIMLLHQERMQVLMKRQNDLLEQVLFQLRLITDDET